MTLLKAGLGLFLAALAAVTPAHADMLGQPQQQALLRALHDEFHAEAFYGAVMEKFGKRRPFSTVIRSERRHQAKIAQLMVAYGMAVPRNSLLGSAEIKAKVPDMLADACQMAVDAEIANRDLYRNDLLPLVHHHADIKAVFERLSFVSDGHHLPAFKRCAQQY